MTKIHFWVKLDILKNARSIFSGIIVHQRLIVPRQMILQSGAVCSVKEGASAILLQSGLDEK